MRVCWRPFGNLCGLPSGFEQRRVAAEPFGVPAAGREAPAPGDAIAALDDDRAAGSRQVRTPGEDAVAVAEYLARGLLGQIRRDHRAAGILSQAPRRAAVALRQRVQDLGIGQRVEFGAAERARQQHAEDAAILHRLDDFRRHLAAALDLVAGFAQHRHQFARPLDIALFEPDIAARLQCVHQPFLRSRRRRSRIGRYCDGIVAQWEMPSRYYRTCVRVITATGSGERRPPVQKKRDGRKLCAGSSS